MGNTVIINQPRRTEIYETTVTGISAGDDTESVGMKNTVWKTIMTAWFGLMFFAIGIVAFLSPTTIIFAPIMLLIGAYLLDKAFNLKLVNLLKGVLK